MKNRHRRAWARAWGSHADGLVDLPVKISASRVAREVSKGVCRYCFPHGVETPNATIRKNKRNWKNQRGRQYRVRCETVFKANGAVQDE